MIRQFLEWVLKVRHGFSALIALSIIVAVFNEIGYRQSVLTLNRGIQLTEIRIKAAQTLQLVTDAETSVRGYIITGQEEHLAVYRTALKELPAVSAEAFDLIEEINVDKTIRVDDVRVLISSKLGELSLLVDFKKLGKQPEIAAVLMANLGTDKMTALRASFERTLHAAAEVQNGYRVSLYDVLASTRWTVYLLILVTLTGLYFLRRQLSYADMHRETANKRQQERTGNLR